MQSFAFERAMRLADACAAAAVADTAVIAGGTELLNWLKDGIAAPRRIVDLGRLPGLDAIAADGPALRIGALARMADVAAHPAVQRDYPAIAQALLASASPQLRNMATMGGNLMQRTRCPYFRTSDLPAEGAPGCNKRRPGSGCAAIGGEDRFAAVLGASQHCIATHPSDVAVALAALDATVQVEGPQGARTVALTDFYLLPGATPERETVLAPGELITAIVVPASAPARRSHYLKLRERASYEFALVSVAVGLDLDGLRIREARLALGGVAPKPWRLPAAERALRGAALADVEALRDALEADLAAAQPGRRNGFKVELARRVAVRALQTAGGLA